MLAPVRADLLSAISTARSFDELGRIIVETLATAFDAEVCTIWRRYHDERGSQRLRLLAASAKAPQTLAQEITYAIYEDDPEGTRADGVTGYVAQTRQEIHVSSFEQLREEYGACWKGRMDKTQWAGEPAHFFRSLVAVPLVLGERLSGVLKLENKREAPDGFPTSDLEDLRELIPDIALAVHSFSLLEPHEQRLIEVPARMVTALLGPFETRQLVSEIVKTVAEGLHAEICSLWLVHTTGAGRELRLADGYGFSTEARAEQTYQLPVGPVAESEVKGITALVAVQKKPFWANSWEELKDHPSWKGKWDQAMWHSQDRPFRCLYALPLLRQDEVIGVLKVENRKDAAFFTESDRALCGIMASLIVLVLDLGQQFRASLISDLAHLIRSPIGQVPANLSGLEREIDRLQQGETPKLGRIEGYLNFIKKALLAATMTSRTLVAYSQRASDPAPAKRATPINLGELIREREIEFKPLLPAGITLKVELAENLPEVAVNLDVTDRTRLQIAIDNILYNAIKYSRDKGTVLVRLDPWERGAILTIQDFGLGIAVEDLPRIFEPGFSVRAPGHPQGTGMGLTTVKQTLDRLGWQMSVESQVGQGTTFKIFIPTPQGAPDAEPSPGSR